MSPGDEQARRREDVQLREFPRSDSRAQFEPQPAEDRYDRRNSDNIIPPQTETINPAIAIVRENLSVRWQRVLFWVPVLAAVISTIGAIFSIRNWAYLDASKTLNFVRTLSPTLTNAHQQIIDKLSEIADLLRNGSRSG